MFADPIVDDFNFLNSKYKVKIPAKVKLGLAHPSQGDSRRLVSQAQITL